MLIPKKAFYKNRKFTCNSQLNCMILLFSKELNEEYKAISAIDENKE